MGAVALAGFSQLASALPATLGSSFYNMALPYAAITDGDTATDSETAGDQSYTLDAGSPQQMQGLYLWMAKSPLRQYWSNVETSADGLNWDTQWRAILTLNNDQHKPLYLPFPKANQSIRYIRINIASDLNGSWSGLAEARWLAAGQPVSLDPDIPHAHWSAPSRSNQLTGYQHSISTAKPMNTPYLVSWSRAATNYLSKATLREATVEEGNCPRIGAISFFPETLVIDASGEMQDFKTTKSMPDGTAAVVLDWSHVDISHDYGGRGEFISGGYPSEQGILRQGRYLYTSTNSHRLAHTSGGHCDGQAGDAHYSRGWYYQNYWEHSQDGSLAAEINADWDTAIITPVNNYTAAVSAGYPFARVFGDAGKPPSDELNTVDGFVDIGSRWSNDEDGSLTFVSGPGLTDAAPIRGLYLWMHRSNNRRSTVSITARADTEDAFNLLPATLLPMTSNKEQPVFIPIHNNAAYIKHITVTGHGNDGGGNSDPVWSSIAELRYSASSTPPIGVPVVPTLDCNAFTGASGSALQGAITGNTPNHTIDADISNLNFWAANTPSMLVLDVGATRTISEIKIWMHKSHIRTSDITLRALSSHDNGRTAVLTQNIHLPLSPMNRAETIPLSRAVSARYIELKFYGNSQSAWNSISEVCWQ